MKIKYYIITLVFSYLLIILAKFPAEPIIKFINENTRVTVQGAYGTLWNGRANLVDIPDAGQLTGVEWSFKLLKLLTGRLAADVQAQYSGRDIHTELGVSFTGEYFANDLTTTQPAQLLAELAQIPLVQLSGMFSINIDQLHWNPGKQPVVSGKINWQDAAVEITESVSLGDVAIKLTTPDEQRVRADIENQGGDISISGNAELLAQADYSVDIIFSPMAPARNSITQSLGAFATRQNNGDYVFRNSGSLESLDLN